jgi:hypothetical protein
MDRTRQSDGNLRADPAGATKRAEILENANGAAPPRLVMRDRSLVKIDQFSIGSAQGCRRSAQISPPLPNGEGAIRVAAGQFRPGPFPSGRPKSSEIGFLDTRRPLAWILLNCTTNLE